MLIRDASLLDGRRADVRVANGRVVAIGTLGRGGDEPAIDARGGLLLPGLHDHHIHLCALAAALGSVRCGPPDVADADALARALARPGDGWLRGIGYHEDVAGLLDARALDRMVPDRPVRVQHRGGRMWFLNSAALSRLAHLSPPPGLEMADGRPTGRLLDSDDWLRASLGSGPPALDEVGARLAARGVTGVTDMSPANDAAMAAHFADERARGALPQRLLLAGRPSLGQAALPDGIGLGPVKVHLRDAALPALDELVGIAVAAHAAGRGVAVHCVTEAELLLALAMFADAGPRRGDRIEHAGLTADHAVATIAALGLWVVGQPHFIAERGDIYRTAVEPELRPLLYRLAAFRDAGVPLAAGSDAPFGDADPWASMAAAVSRRTRGGTVMGAAEALSPEQALALYLREPDALDQTREVTVGAPADLCLLDRDWPSARGVLADVRVRATMIGGRIIHDRVDETPVQRGARADPPPG